MKNRYQNAFSQIEVQLKRPYDLIPNLVEIARGYMAHERETLAAVIAARNNAAAILQAIGQQGAGGVEMSQLGAAEGALGKVLGAFISIVWPKPPGCGAFAPALIGLGRASTSGMYQQPFRVGKVFNLTRAVWFNELASLMLAIVYLSVGSYH